MRKWTWKTKIRWALGSASMCFLTYLICCVRSMTQLPVVHTLWSTELAFLVRTIAQSVQLLGLLAGGSALLSAMNTWKRTRTFGYRQFAQASFLALVALIIPDAAAQCIPVLFGVILDF